MSDDKRPRAGKKKHRKPEAEADPEFQIAPMIDILLVLLVFFMSISSTEVLQQNQNVDLPVAKEAKDKPKQIPDGQVIVNVLYVPLNNATTIEVDERPLTIQELGPFLKSKVAKAPQMRVLVRADKEVRYEFIRQLLESVGLSGIGNVTFSVVDKDANAPKAKF
jgi:biopolymer transport protein ExbD